MANLTRAQMRAELQSHGWSRFAAADLDRYLDWALQTTYAEGSFDRSVRDNTTVAGVVTDQVTFASITGASSELLQSVRSVRRKGSDGVAQKLRHTTEEFFEEHVRDNMLSGTPITGTPSYYYVYDGNVVLYPKPDSAIDIIVDFMRRKDTFSGDADTTGLPERYDKIVLMWAESYCHRRAREVDMQLNLERSARDAMLRELGQEESEDAEYVGRVTPWGA